MQALTTVGDEQEDEIVVADSKRCGRLRLVTGFEDVLPPTIAGAPALVDLHADSGRRAPMNGQSGDFRSLHAEQAR